jgi:D-alanine-D-alanine ligase
VNIENDIARLQKLLSENPPDVIFNLVESFRSDQHLEAPVAGLFELHGIPFTGAPSFTLGLCLRKGMTKKLLLQQRIPTPRFKLLPSPAVPRRHGLHYPIIVKPARHDASVGVLPHSVVTDFGQLTERVKEVFNEFKVPVLIEEFVEGRELHVSIWGNEKPEVLPILEYDFSELPEDHPNIITYDVKWNPLNQAYHKVHARCPAVLPRTLERRVKEVALAAYRETRCRDYARIDMRLSVDNKPYVLEVNPNPDLTSGVSFMECAEKAGHTFSRAVARIVEMAWQRRPSR